MCKSSCCPGDHRSGLGTAVAAVAALAVLSAAARPLIHAAELVIQAALITIGAAVTLTVVVLVTLLLTRARRATARPAPGQLVISRTAVVPCPPARTWAQAQIADRISRLSMPALAPPALCPSCRGIGEQYYQARDGEFVLAACDTCGNGRVGSKGTGVTSREGRPGNAR